MSAIVFLLLVIAVLIFCYLLNNKMPDESRAFVTRIIQLIPDGDSKGFALCLALLFCVLLIVIVIFR